ncbi:hypothetical protein [Falsiroseomonas sp. HW251]|uniref:hypothetical protein n=1 Tax=Falsiroseomonas sp. HW251 TaxID=3390998 RepID=UPI003D311BD8
MGVDEARSHPIRRRALILGTAAALVAGRAAAQQGGKPIAAPSSAGDPATFVRDLYSMHLAAFTSSGSGSGALGRATLDRVFAPDLARAIRRDDAQARRAGVMPELDFDPITDSQDPDVHGLAIRLLGTGERRATVEARFRQGGTRMTVLHYELIATNAGWRVVEIARPGPDGWSLRRILHAG